MIDLLAFFAYVPASRSLGELLNHSQYDEVLIHLVKALAKVGGRHAVPRLTEMLGHRNWVVRAQAATTLAALRATESASEVTALLEDGDIRVRVAAQRSVRRLQAINRPPVDRPLEVVA
jgi:HEAT repeat protein